MKNIISVFMAVALTFIMQTSYGLTDHQVDKNKQNAVEFLNQAVNQKDFAAASKYLGSGYIQHNPMAADGSEGLKVFIQYIRDNYPDNHSEIIRVFGEGNFVTMQVHSVRVPGTRGRAIFELFRFENGKIVEHWDAAEDVPETSANSNGMF